MSAVNYIARKGWGLEIYSEYEVNGGVEMNVFSDDMTIMISKRAWDDFQDVVLWHEVGHIEHGHIHAGLIRYQRSIVHEIEADKFASNRTNPQAMIDLLNHIVKNCQLHSLSLMEIAARVKALKSY